MTKRVRKRKYESRRDRRTDEKNETKFKYIFHDISSRSQFQNPDIIDCQQ
jgi:hypothetical protein